MMASSSGAQPDDQSTAAAIPETSPNLKRLPTGVVLGPDGKPCRSCTSFASWAATTKSTVGTTTGTTTASQSKPSIPCPPDVDQLGRGTWTLLHSIAGTYPVTADSSTRSAARSFLISLATLYPCWHCASHFKQYIADHELSDSKLAGRSQFGWWLCLAHNDVNKRLGKPQFDCNDWETRWAPDKPRDDC